MLRKLKEEAGIDVSKEIKVTRNPIRLICEAGFYRVITSTLVTPAITFVTTMDWAKIGHNIASGSLGETVHSLGTGNRAYAQAIIWKEMLVKVPGQALFKYCFDRLVPYGYKLVRTSDFKALGKDEELAERVPKRIIDSLKKKQGIDPSEDVVVIATGSRAWAEATMYRLYASFIETPLVAYWATGHWKNAAAIVAGELLTKVFTYRYIHKVWDHTTWGLNVSQKGKNGGLISLDLLRGEEGTGSAS
jgi:uncharacterized membrane protein